MRQKRRGGQRTMVFVNGADICKIENLMSAIVRFLTLFRDSRAGKGNRLLRSLDA